MPRDSAGNYSLVSGNPVESGEIIASTWANTTLSDVSDALTNSLDRQGRGGMLAPFRFTDGSNLLPGASWSNETTTGLYRFDGGDLRMSILTQDIMRWRNTGVQVWNLAEGQWDDILSSADVILDSGTAQGQTLRWDQDTDQKWIPTSDLIIDDTGNVGIGNVTPNNFGGFTTLSVGDTDRGSVEVWQGGASAGAFYAGSGGGVLLQADGANTMTFRVNSSPAMTIDSAGDVGIGTSSPSQKLEVSAGAYPAKFRSSVTGTGNRGILLLDGDSTSETAARLGCEGNALTFGTGGASTERMRIDGAGNVGIGDTDPSYQLTLSTASTSYFNMNSGAGASSRILFGDLTNGIRGTMIYNPANQSLAVTPNQTGGDARFGGFTVTADLMEVGGDFNDTDLVVIGNVGIGNNSPSEKLHVGDGASSAQITLDSSNWSRINFEAPAANGSYLDFNELGVTHGSIFYFNADDYMSFSTWDTSKKERMRITSDGNLLVGGTTIIGSSLSSVEAPSGKVGLGVYRASNNASFSVQVWHSDFNGVNTQCSRVLADGVYTASSDASLKENIADSKLGLAKVLQLQVREFDWRHSGNHVDAGFIAQELKEVLPQAGVGEEGSMSRADAHILPVLVKAIQELAAKVEALEAQIGETNA